jgi:hypothetical protein
MGFNHNHMFSSGSLLFTESMPQVKESQSMDQQYFKEKIPTAIGNYSAFQSTMLASSLD